ACVVEVVAVDEHLALDARAGDHLVHAVEGADEGRLTASGWPDEGGHGSRLDREGHVFDGLEAAVVDVEVADFDALGHGFLLLRFGVSGRPWARTRAPRLGRAG